MLPQLVCLTKALNNLNIPFSQLDYDGNLIRVELPGQHYLFQKSYTPFNSESVGKICLDKEHTYHILKNVIEMPKTLGFLDFSVADSYPEYVRFKNLDEMVESIEQQLVYPMVIKKNSGALSKNVFLCNAKQELVLALETIFDKKSNSYDYVALAQTFIHTQEEYRAVFFNKKLVLAYERYTDQKNFKAGYWNLPGGCSKHITDPSLLKELQTFIEPIFQHIPAIMVGVDIIRDITGKLFLIELNSGARFNHFIQFNGENPVIQMYENIFQQLLGPVNTI
ncbi:ATP-grasp domain-containing protein [Zooshikella sp. RANM57]|uniref:ATP-grasp domain-containing protein n=1 Tax=Zooshikella sp. RANM57 TaxID=3425863 RepID=UPI003D6EE0F0